MRDPAVHSASQSFGGSSFRTPTPAPKYGWLLYDGSCGVCSRGVAFWQPVLRRYGIGTAALQNDWVQSRLELSDEELLSNVRLLTQSGSHIEGADVYRYIMRHIWWAYPLYLLSRLPGLRTIFNWSYRRFADRRHHISRVCKIDVVAR